MRYLTYFTAQNNRIDVHNSWDGTEQVFYNGELMSKAKTICGTTHRFSVVETGEHVDYVLVVSYKFFAGISFDLYRDDVALLLSHKDEADQTLNDLKSRRSIYSLLIIIGAAFIALAVYDFIIAGYSFKGVHFVTTMIFGMLWPIIAIKKIIALNKTEKRLLETSDNSF